LALSFHAPGSFKGEPAETSGREGGADPSGHPFKAPLFLRIPGWTVNPEILVNGRRWGLEGRGAEPRSGGEPPSGVDCSLLPGSWARIEREWRTGDQVTLKLPVYTRTVEREYRGDCIRAFSRGPLVLAAKGIWPDGQALPGVESSACPEPMGAGRHGEPRHGLPLRQGTVETGGSPAAEAVLMPCCQAGAERLGP